MDKLREDFFKEHVSHKTSDGIPVVSTHPHNLFEWFKDKMQKQQSLPTDSVSSCGYCGEHMFNEKCEKAPLNKCVHSGCSYR